MDGGSNPQEEARTTITVPLHGLPTISDGSPSPSSVQDLTSRLSAKPFKPAKNLQNLLGPDVLSLLQDEVFVWSEKAGMVQFTAPNSDLLELISSNTVQNIIKLYNKQADTTDGELRRAALGDGGTQKKLNKEQLSSIRSTRSFKVPASSSFPNQHHTWELSSWLQFSKKFRTELHTLLPLYDFLFFIFPTHTFHKMHESDSYANMVDGLFYCVFPLLFIPHCILGSPMKEKRSLGEEFMVTFSETVSKMIEGGLTESASQHFSKVRMLIHAVRKNDRIQKVMTAKHRKLSGQDFFQFTTANVIQETAKLLQSLGSDEDLKAQLGSTDAMDALIDEFRFLAVSALYAVDTDEMTPKDAERIVEEKHRVRGKSPMWREWKADNVLKESIRKFEQGFIPRLREALRESHLSPSGKAFYMELITILEDGPFLSLLSKALMEHRAKLCPYVRDTWKFPCFLRRNHKIEGSPGMIKMVTKWQVQLPRMWGWCLYHIPLDIFEMMLDGVYLTTNNIWGGLRGIKFVFSPSDEFTHYGYDQAKTERSGRLVRAKHNTLWYEVKSLWSACKDKRDRFEMQPDTGIIPKGFSRVVNLIEVWVFMFFLGTQILLLFELFNFVVFVSFMFLVLVTLPVWAVLYALLKYIYSTGFLGDEEDGRQWPLISGASRFPSLVAPASYPLAHVLIVWIRLGIFQLIWSVLKAFIISPLYVLIVVPLRATAFVFTLWHDFVMYNLVIKRRARVPMSNSFLAVRTAGPGVAAMHRMQINTESAIVLLHSQLERIELSMYRSSLRHAIEAPLRALISFDEKASTMLNLAGFSFNVGPSMKDTLRTEARVKELAEAVDTAVKRREKFMAEAIKLRNIGMARDNHQDFMARAETFVTQFAETRLSRWVSDESFSIGKGKKGRKMSWMPHETPQGARHERLVRDGKFKALTQQIVTDMFGHSFLEPLEDMDITHSVELERINLGSYLTMMTESKPRHELDKGILKDNRKVVMVKPSQDVFPGNPLLVHSLQFSSALNDLVLDARSGTTIQKKDFNQSQWESVIQLASRCPFPEPVHLVLQNTAIPEYDRGHRFVVSQPATTLADEHGMTHAQQVEMVTADNMV